MKIFYATTLLLFFTFAINLWIRKFITADVTAVFVNNQHGIQRRGQDFDKKKFVFVWVNSKEVDRRISGENWTKSGVNKLLNKLRNTDPPNAATQPALFRATHILSKKGAMPCYV